MATANIVYNASSVISASLMVVVSVKLRVRFPEKPQGYSKVDAPPHRDGGIFVRTSGSGLQAAFWMKVLETMVSDLGTLANHGKR